MEKMEMMEMRSRSFGMWCFSGTYCNHLGRCLEIKVGADTKPYGMPEAITNSKSNLNQDTIWTIRGFVHLPEKRYEFVTNLSMRLRWYPKMVGL